MAKRCCVSSTWRWIGWSEPTRQTSSAPSHNTVLGVVYGLLGTALAQGFVATIGFAIAGGGRRPLLLGTATALLSLIPIGPPLIWGGAAIWLFYQGTVGWGVFMLLWGFFLISGVDKW